VVLMEELDQLVTPKKDVYDFFKWATFVGSKLDVIAVADTMGFLTWQVQFCFLNIVSLTIKKRYDSD
jgi:Cdc6-like AAA superfamily ATPase